MTRANVIGLKLFAGLVIGSLVGVVLGTLLWLWATR